MIKITQKQIKELIKRVLKASYNDVMELRNRLSPYGEDLIFQEDQSTLDIVLDLYDLLDLLLNGGDEESIKDKYLEIAEFYYWQLAKDFKELYDLENSFSGMDKKRKVRQKKKILLSDKYY